MRTAALTTLATVAGLLLGVCAQAQQPPEPSGRPVALPASPPPDYGPPIANEQAKARTSALFRRPSKAFADQFAAGNVAFMTFPDGARPIASEGGIPIILNGKLIGAIGVSGGTAPQDGVAAAAGVNAVKPSP